MKKVLLYGLSLALVLSLAACQKPQADQPDQPDPPSPAASIPAPEPEPAPEPAAAPEPVTTPEPPQVPADPGPLTEQAPAAPEEDGASQPPEGAALQEPEEPAPEVQLFHDCNETVYATGTVNIRSSWSTSSDKLGSLSVGQSVTRTGTSVKGTEAEGWSRVQLSDGTTAYISNSYLSTTKPVQQQSSTETGTDTPTTSQPSTETTSSSSGHSGSHWDQAFYDTLTPEQKAMYESFSDATREDMELQVQDNREAEANGWHTTLGDDQITQEDRNNLIDGLNGN